MGDVAPKSGIKILILKLKTWGQVDICLETSTFYLTKKRKYVVSKKKKKKKEKEYIVSTSLELLSFFFFAINLFYDIFFLLGFLSNASIDIHIANNIEKLYTFLQILFRGR